MEASPSSSNIALDLTVFLTGSLRLKALPAFTSLGCVVFKMFQVFATLEREKIKEPPRRVPPTLTGRATVQVVLNLKQLI